MEGDPRFYKGKKVRKNFLKIFSLTFFCTKEFSDAKRGCAAADNISMESLKKTAKVDIMSEPSE